MMGKLVQDRGEDTLPIALRRRRRRRDTETRGTLPPARVVRQIEAGGHPHYHNLTRECAGSSPKEESKLVERGAQTIPALTKGEEGSRVV